MAEDRRKEDSLLAAQTITTGPEPPPEAWPTPYPGLAQLFEEHHKRIFHAAFRVTGSSSDAEDVLQTVFLRLMRREEAPVLEAAGAGSYFHRAAVNAALDLLRARRRTRAVGLDDAEAELPSAREADPERTAGSRQLAACLRQALTQLSPRAAEMFSLRYFEGLGNREIAELFGSSQTAVAVILHRTRSRLEKNLRPLLGGSSLMGGH
jgi:RNA polymerase sigma-70 factor, ECF subfamily